MSSSGSDSLTVNVVSTHEPEQLGARAASNVFGRRQLRKPKMAFETMLPEWVMAGKPPKPGLLLAIWWLYARLALYKFEWIPQPPVRLSYSSAIAELSQRINQNQQRSMSITSVMTTKGGATKTTVSTWLSAVLAAATHKPVAILDVDRGGGKVAKRFGFDPGDVMDTTALVRHVLGGKPFDFATLNDITRSDGETGVNVFHQLPGQSTKEENMKHVLGILKTAIHTLVIDTGPGLRVPSTNAAVDVSGVRVVVGNGNSYDDMDSVGETLEHSAYGLQHQLDTVIIAVSALRRRSCNTRSQYRYAERYGVSPSQIVLIPFNRYLQRTGQVKLSKLSRDTRTLYAFYELAYRVTEAAIASKSM